MLRTGSRFTTEVVSLIGTKIFAKTVTPHVTAVIVPYEELSELKLSELTTSDNENKSHKEQWGEINNNIQGLENGKMCQANFRNLQLKSIKRRNTTTKEGNEFVFEDLFSLIFSTKFRCHGMEFKLCTQSLPLAVVSHDIQRMKANATIVWNNAGFNPFESQKELPWIQVNYVLCSRYSFNS